MGYERKVFGLSCFFFNENIVDIRYCGTVSSNYCMQLMLHPVLLHLYHLCTTCKVLFGLLQNSRITLFY